MFYLIMLIIEVVFYVQISSAEASDTQQLDDESYDLSSNLSSSYDADALSRTPEKKPYLHIFRPLDARPGFVRPPQSTKTPTTTLSASPETSTLKTLTDEEVRKSDPFYMTPQAEQVNCTSIGTNYKTCSYIDWLKIYNKTIAASVTAAKYYNNFDEKSCFRRCNLTISCVLYTFNKLNGTCRIHNEVKFENIKNDTNWSMFVRISPRFIFLSEWIVTRDVIPRGIPLHTDTVSDFFECTVRCSNSVKCVFATLNRDNNTCSLYSKSATQIMGLKGNHVSIQHISFSRNDNLWRFRNVGPVYQMDTSSTGLTTESLENCLEFCYSKNSCQLATTAASSMGTVDCFLYDNFQNRWFEDDPPTKATNSYYKIVSRNNTQYKTLPHFVTVVSSTKPVETIRMSKLTGCHRKALNSISCYWYSYNSTSKICNLYDSSVRIRKTKSFIKNDLTTFSKSIPTQYLPFYGFDSTWISKISLNSVPSSGQSSGQQCLGRCLELENCSGVTIQMPEGNCSFYTQASLTTILNNRNGTADVGLQTIQMFVKTGDPRFIRSERQFRCSNNQQVTWDEINQILQFGTLDKIRNDIPRGNNLPLTPHGSSFEGPGNGTTNLVSIQRSKMAKVEETDLRWQRLSKEMIGKVYTYDVAIFSTVGAVFGGPVGGTIGSGLGIGIATATVLLDNIICFFSSCDKIEEKESCGKRCAGPSSDSFLRSISTRANDCICRGQPEVQRGGNLQIHRDDQDDDLEGDMQENCDGKRVGEVCNICCRVGYEPEENPVCTCSDNSDNFWNPNPARCVGSNNCNLGPTVWGGIEMHVLKVSDCRDHLYYGLVFNIQKRIPFYTVYHFTYINVNFDNPNINRGRWVALACTDIATSQLTQDDYAVLNAYHRNPSVAYFDKGHLTPNADVRYRKDAVKSTFVYANAAPQDHYSNFVPWKKLEERLRILFSEPFGNGEIRQGYVITGVCLDDDAQYSVPDCFWKLACTRTDNNTVTVGGFYHKNIISTTEQEKEERNREVNQVRDQRSMRNLGQFDLLALWDEAAGFFINSEDQTAMAQCRNADPILFPKEGTRAAADYALYNFWNEKIFGEGFNNSSSETDEETVALSEAGSPPSCGTKVVGYVTGWSDVKFTSNAASYLTHVIFAFVQMKSDGTLLVGSADPENSNNVNIDTKKSYLRLYEIKAAKEKSGNRLRTAFAVGGWANSQYFSAVVGSGQLTENFIRTALEILDYFNMDGIDIDFEYPVTGGANEGVKEDRENYVSFLKSLKTALASHQRIQRRSEPYSLTIAGAAGSWVLEDGFDLAAIADIVDWINVMTYDYNGAWESKWGAYTGPHAPLYYGAPQGYSGKTNVDYTMKYYSCRIQNPNKLVMGLGFYGRFWNHSGEVIDSVWRMADKNAAGKFDGGFEPWRSIVTNYLSNPAFKKSFHEKTQTPYLENSSGFLMGYEDTRSIHEKVKYASAKKFAGVMIWAVDLDDARNTLLRTASSESLCSSAAAGISPDYKCPPIQEQRWWTLLDDKDKAGMCGKSAPLYKGYYPVCDPEDPGYACCSSSGFCGSSDTFCNCDGCVNYYENPEKILDEPIRPSSPVRWHTMDKFKPGPQCGYLGQKLESGDYAICNPDDENGFCCSAAGYCGKKSESCDCEGCVNFKKNPNFRYPQKTWIDSGPDAGKCGKNANVNGNPATCNPLSKDYYCCSASGYCGSGPEYCNCNGCVNYKNAK